MPAYNEAAQIETSVREWHEGVAARIPGAELVIVDDCSRDGTFERLTALAGALPRLCILRTEANAGHGPAVRFGLDRCSGEFIFQTDSDRQHTPDDFWALWQRRDEADFIVGHRRRRADGIARAVISSVLRGVNVALWGHWIGDANCPFKLMRRDALHALLAEIPRQTFIPMVMVSVLARAHGYRVLEVPVRHFPRTAGRPSLAGVARWTRVGAVCVRELVSLRMAVARRDRRAAALAMGKPTNVR